MKDEYDRRLCLGIVFLWDVDKIGSIAAIDFDSPCVISGPEGFSGKGWHSDQAYQTENAET